jgi:putative PIN family toxin of toxin-antitoxin system
VRVVADTNTVISGLLWRGNPSRVLETARTGSIQLFTSLALLAELDEVLQRPKFTQRLSLAAVTSRELVVGYAALASIVQPAAIAPVVIDDPDDDAVLACALAARAETIVSGDGHLLDLREYGGILILTAAQLLSKLES